ncbi:MAG: TetR/AcrR family transcriptional regulator [Hamadaea sp.]|uniref:TetR/AcrR family transcriptional regulator n=1 Tax=Hamadaea sp. TaxID=2024425 RepID=UPI00185282CF|nr:TetR/AcrR family transcriptional regulator [Hamadaea sp.]NUR73977.1 TetR/AcrR family transcriptional regulator [Hamadaea sp.]NUT22386.1 TetR/AcrR family transcriptional regulator [Hamadaea sp.]
MQGEGTEVNGRKRRWAAHREQRRIELIQAAIAAVLEHGPEVDMEQVAAAAGVSKPVLYRYFADKSQLWIAVGQHLASVVVDAVAPAVEQVREERTLIEATIDAYLGVIEAQPNLYRFVMHQSGIPGVHQLIVGASREVAVELARVIGDRLRALGLDAGPAEPWAYGLVGFVQSVGDWWMQHGRPIRREALTDYLTELLWSGFDGLRRRADLPLEIRAIK